MSKKVTCSEEIILHFSPSYEDRKYARFSNNLGTLVELDSTFEKPFFINCVKGLIINDSLGGCNLIAATTQVLESNQICLMRSEGLSPIKVKIVWVKKIETNIFRIGIEYFDELYSDELNLS